ncbi:transcriptional regulator [Brachybacterium tyrofermentans]|uniref:transcriptional regulator n=1 Tax=Brachybacterium tyrofermentans TaxID=47848 RepID=UPI003FCF82A0
MSAEPVASFHEVIHAPLRLRICGLLRQISELEFGVARDTLGVTDAHLSKNLKVLADANMVVLRKEKSPSRTDARRLTWVALTPAGRIALEEHLASLTRIAAGEV